jgi:hypothetical protein
MLLSRWYVRINPEILWTSTFFILIFLIYMSTLNLLVWGDTITSRYLPISIIRELNFDLNEFNFPYDREIPYFLQYRDGRIISSYPVGAALTALPFYLVPVLLGMSAQSPWVPLLEKFSAASITVFSALFLYLALRRLTRHKTSLVVTAIYALCTSSFSISSQALWQHGPSQFLLAVGLYCLIRGLSEEDFIPWSAFPLSAAILCRPTNVLMVLPILVYICFHKRKLLRRWIAYASPPAVFLMAYNYHYFGSIYDSGYGTGVLLPSSIFWSAPFLYGWLGVLISPSKGLFTYSPVLLFAVVGIFLIWKKKSEPLLKYLGFGPFLVLILYGKWHFWWGGETYGPRLVTDITLFLSLYIYPIWDATEHKGALKALLVLLSMISLLMHAIGAFGFDSSWYRKTNVAVERDRLWSLSDSPFIHYGRQLFLKNFSILRTSISSLPTSPQFPDALAASLVHREVPSLHTAGEPFTLPVVATNTGLAIWLFQTNNGQHGVRLGWRWIGSEGEVPYSEGRAPLQRDIFPGEQEELKVEIWPPSVEGDYVLELGMISEPITWFGVQRFPLKIVGTCHFEDAIHKPVKFLHGAPDIAITQDKPSYSAGEMARIGLNITNGAIPRNLRLSVFLRHPDGHLRCLNSAAEMLPNPPCSQWIPMAAPHILSREFSIDWQLSLRLNNIPHGPYILYALMTEPGSVEVIARSSSIFYLSASGVEEDLDGLGKVSENSMLEIKD